MIVTLLLSLIAFMCQSGDSTVSGTQQADEPMTTADSAPSIEYDSNLTSLQPPDKQILPEPRIDSVREASEDSEYHVDVEQESTAVQTDQNNEPKELRKSEPSPKATVDPSTPEHTGGILIQEPTVILEVAGLDHNAFDELLQSHVTSDGRVNYEGLKGEIAKLDDYLKILMDNAPATDWTRDARLAYWINAYNAFTIKLILNNYPLTSIMDLDGGKPWDKQWIQIGGKSYSLNDIEHKIIRPKFNDARIHFAVNCAAKSCPPLANSAYTESNVTSLLENQTSKFINNEVYNTISSNSAKISKIFDWYKEDFGNLVDYLNKYSETKLEASAEITFHEYNWKLNN